MPITETARKRLLERLNAVAPVSDRRMFGGLGLYCAGRFFALIDDDTLYFKVDDINRPDYVKAGMDPFMPPGAASGSKGYFRVPDEVIADGRKLKAWVVKSVAAAERAAEKKGTKKPSLGKRAARRNGMPRAARRS
ncbi:MAG: hypothetical protein JWO30_4418 [Fibrobacteres bacterium]|nr:hypothetical protein [Fibrobacterota bacterium]